MFRPLKHLFKSQKGAMFGMDARIALGAFAALSVVVGYQITSRIGMAEYGTILKEFQAVETAMMNMQADMGVFYEFAIDPDKAADTGIGHIADTRIYALYDDDYVKDNFKSKWTGPYLDSDPKDGFIAVRNPSNPSIAGATLLRAFPNIRTPPASVVNEGACNIDNECYIWLRRFQIPAEYAIAINEIVDENGGETPELSPGTEGRIRYIRSGGSSTLDYRTEVMRRP